jgi:Protein of unknown function (DUF3176)
MAAAKAGNGPVTILEEPELAPEVVESTTKTQSHEISELDDEKAFRNGPDREAPKGLWDRIQDYFGGWLVDYLAVFVSAIAIIGLSCFLWHFDGQPAPSWSYSAPNSSPKSIAGRSAHVSINAILELFSTTARIALGFSLTKALGQLTWVWFKKGKRQLADFSVFDQAAKHSPMGSLKLIMMLKARSVSFAFSTSLVLAGWY